MSMQQRQQIAMLQQQQRSRMTQMQAAQQAQQSQSAQGGMWILRLMNFNDHLSNFNETNGKELSVWQNFVERHFADQGRLIHSFDSSPPNGTGQGRGKIFEVLRPTIARYFWTYFDSGASSLRLHTEHAREMPHPTGSHQVQCQNAVLSVSYPNGARLEMSGSLHVLFTAGSDSIECLHFQTTSTEETLARSRIEKVVSEWSPSMTNKASPKMAKNKLPKAQQKLQDQQERLTIDHFPKTPKGTMGVTSKVQQFLEVSNGVGSADSYIAI